MESYKLRLREAIIPLFGKWMYENRTLDNENFIKNSLPLEIKKARFREGILTAYYMSASFATGVGLFIGLNKLINIVNQ